VDDELVLRTYDNPLDAELAANYLRANGVDARIDNDVLQGMNPVLAPALGGVRLHVRAEQAETAEDLLERVRVRRKQLNEADREASRAAAASLLGYTLFPVVGVLYSAWKLSGIKTHQLTARGRRDFRFALFLNVAMLAFFVYVVIG
jgi:hypothetical protein